MNRIREILRLGATQDMSQRMIARAVGVSRPAVSRYLSAFTCSGLKYEETVDLPDSELLSCLDPKSSRSESRRYQDLCSFFPYFLSELKRVGVTRQLLWKEYLLKHPDGYQYTQFCHHFRVWYEDAQLTMHLDHKAGDKMFVDYAGKKLAWVDRKSGELVWAEVFISVLGASGMMYAEATPSQKSEDWILSNERALHYYGGCPAVIVPDNLKSAVDRSDRYEPGLNQQYEDFAGHYGVVILPGRVSHARDKALVENAVHLAYLRIYAPLRDRNFYSLAELNQAIAEHLEIHNRTPMQRIRVSRQELFERIEKPALQPLPAERYEIRKFRKLKVQINYHIELREDRHYYSVRTVSGADRYRCYTGNGRCRCITTMCG